MMDFQVEVDGQMVDNFSFMKKMVIEGLKDKGVYDDFWYQEHLEEELKIIKKTGIEDFFIHIAYICALIDDKGIFRGSARGNCLASVVCYGLNITYIPPKYYNLSFSLFLNEEMNQLPDISIEVYSDQREEALQLIIDEFGEDRCCQVISRAYYSPRIAFIELARMIDLPAEIYSINCLLTDDNDYTKNTQVMKNLDKYPFIKHGMEDIIGLLAALGKDSSSLIIFDEPLWNYASVLNVAGSRVISNTVKECDLQGFFKINIQSDETLDIQKDCLKLIDDSNIRLPHDFNDPKVFKTICDNPLGIFQLENANGRRGVKIVQPKNFNELVSIFSLIRSEARNSGMDKLYCDYKFGRQDPSYLDSRLQDILSDTFGLMIFQEDIVVVARELAVMSDLEINHLINALSKKKKESFAELKPKFLQGCMDNNFKVEVAEKLWNDILNATNYSFYKSHAVSYAALGYQSAWLKTYYPLEFAAAMLMHVKDKEKRSEVLQSIKDSKATLYNIDINKSLLNTTIIDNKIYMGFDLIERVSIKPYMAIIEEREKNGLFKSFEDYCRRINPRKADNRIKSNLMLAGAFDNIPKYNNA